MNYNETIRPRGETVLKGRKQIDSAEWTEIIKGDDAQFCLRMGVELEAFLKLKNERNPNAEMDLRKPAYSNFFDKNRY